MGQPSDPQGGGLWRVGKLSPGRCHTGRADAFVTADYKYHEFFEADGRILIADIGPV